MPLTAKGEDILASMKKEYGDKKGEEVFYASRNKGTIAGVDSEPTLLERLDTMAQQVNGLGKEAVTARIDSNVKFFVTFSYINPSRGFTSTGGATVFASSLEDAAKQIMRERDIKEITIKKRIVTSGNGEQKIENINRIFKHDAVGGKAEARVSPTLLGRLDSMAEQLNGLGKEAAAVTQRMDSSALANEMERKATEHRALGKGRDQSAHMRAFKDYMSAAKFYERAENSKDAKEKISWMEWGDKAKMAAERSSSNAYRDEPNGYMSIKTPQASWGDVKIQRPTIIGRKY